MSKSIVGAVVCVILGAVCLIAKLAGKSPRPSLFDDHTHCDDDMYEYDDSENDDDLEEEDY